MIFFSLCLTIFLANLIIWLVGTYEFFDRDCIFSCFCKYLELFLQVLVSYTWKCLIIFTFCFQALLGKSPQPSVVLFWFPFWALQSAWFSALFLLPKFYVYQGLCWFCPLLSWASNFAKVFPYLISISSGIIVFIMWSHVTISHILTR